tara:strand:- start:5168 stop:6280 length:1113 start_codon:yes stop_codon:yes gene_type:complete
MKNTKIIVKTKNKSYPIYFGSGIIKKTPIFIKQNLFGVKKICLLFDSNIPTKFLINLKKSLKRYDLYIYKIKTSEKIKNFKFAFQLTEKLLKNNFNRNDCVIVMGGGVLGDISAFVSSITKRGIKLINIPSTLLAQVDSSVGGKTGINSVYGKNLIGTFYQPDFIIVDIKLLKSLPKRQIICGYAEILKHSLILDRKFFLWLNKNAKKIINDKIENVLKQAIIKSCEIKSKIINKDENEKDLRMILNFGHTFAHGFEATNNFSKKLNHGEAVLLGMIMACKLSFQKKLLVKKDLVLIEKHYKNHFLPTKISNFFKKSKINNITFFMTKDKKNYNDKINLILLKKIGKTTKPNNFLINRNGLNKFLIKNYK